VIRRAIDWFVPPALLSAGVESPRRARAIVGFCLVGVISGAAFSAAYWFTLSSDVRAYAAGTTLSFLVLTTAELLIGRRWWAMHADGFTLFTNLALSLSLVVWFTGGADSPALWWYVALPMIGLSEWTRRRSLIALLVGAGMLFCWFLIDSPAHPVGHDLSRDSRPLIVFLAQLGLLIAVAVMTLAYEMAKDSSMRRIEKTNQALEQVGREAVAASKVKSAFLANMSHELRTPLTAILGFTEVTLERFAAGSQERNWLEIVRRNGVHMLQLVNDILDLSRIEADKLELERSRCSVFQLVADVASLMLAREEQRAIPLRVRFDTALPEWIETDPRRLSQILINLVGNAIKFTESGSVTLSAALVGGDVDSRIEFTVTDTGIGMTETQQLALFAAFSQGDGSTSRKYGGSGLGLAISQTLARKFGGVITAESTLGVGSTFRFSIPTGVGPEVRRVTHARDPRVATAIGVGTGRPGLRGRCEGMRVLLAEDGRDNQILLDLLLRREGATVTIVDNGQSAVDRALAAVALDEPYDVVLMDVQMPILDGHSATRALRLVGYPHRIIALTANAMSGDRERSLAAGCDDFIAKPIDRDVLISAVEACAAPKAEREA
jgi:signal transduction histidine kinase/CheY-like chemotaxis protein